MANPTFGFENQSLGEFLIGFRLLCLGWRIHPLLETMVSTTSLREPPLFPLLGFQHVLPPSLVGLSIKAHTKCFLGGPLVEALFDSIPRRFGWVGCTGRPPVLEAWETTFTPFVQWASFSGEIWNDSIPLLPPNVMVSTMVSK